MLDGHIRKSQPGMPQDKNFAALQLAAFQTLPAHNHIPPADVHRHYPAPPVCMQRAPRQPYPPPSVFPGRENDQSAANMQHDSAAACPAAGPQLRQALAEPQGAVLPEQQKLEPQDQSKEGWQAHERRLAALEASLLERANLASRALSNVAASIPQVPLVF